MQKRIEEIRAEVEQRLSQKRWEHTRLVADIAVYIADALEYDIIKAETAALLHDIAREYTYDELMATVEKYSVYLNRYNRSFIPSIHGKVGAAIAENEFGVTDKEILLAITNHVSGRPCMKLLEIIIYTSDHLARLKVMDENAFESYRGLILNESLFRILRMVIEYDVEHNKTIDERTSQTFDWLFVKLNQRISHKEDFLSDEIMDMYIDQIDRVLAIYKENRIPFESILNSRDMGGYKTPEGKSIKKNMIFRSSALCGVTEKDKELLNGMGPNYIIDLRTDHEAKMNPDINIAGKNYCHLPLSSKASTEYADILEDWFRECDDAEEAAWLYAEYSDTRNMDELYAELLKDEGTKRVLNEILKIMLKDDCRGVLIHCTSGKDRVGIIISFILKVLGICEDTIRDDFLISQIPYLGVCHEITYKLWDMNYSLETQIRAVGVFGVEMNRPDKMQEVVLDGYPDQESCLKDYFWISDDDILRLRAKYME